MRMLSRLFRWRLALMNGIAAVAGSLLFPTQPEPGRLLALFAGVALLAAAASTFNQLFERDLDGIMLRTRNRPLPTGALAPRTVAIVGAGLVVAGALPLWVTAGPVPPMLGMAVLVWYLAIYTPLKKISSLALAVGAVCGAVMPLIGWIFAGGAPTDIPPLCLALLLYLWQVPHFWLLQRRHADDYRRAGFPVFDPSAYGLSPTPFFLIWVLALVAVVLMLPAFGMVTSRSALCCGMICAPSLIALSRRLEPALFAYLNLFPLLVTASLWLAK